MRHKKESIKEEQINLPNIVNITRQEFKPEWFEMKSHDAEPSKTPELDTVSITDPHAVSGNLKIRSDLELEDDLIEPENPIDAEIKKQLIAFTDKMNIKEHEATGYSAEIREQLTDVTAGKKTTGKRKAIKKAKNSRKKKK
ncbi:MAG: hypothetical protein FIB08_13475 [Candidatus Methanoperedens sp.]|nr:hypothetical protein [Candidatus Methanoperedens sp.]